MKTSKSDWPAILIIPLTFVALIGAIKLFSCQPLQPPPLTPEIINISTDAVSFRKEKHYLGNIYFWATAEGTETEISPWEYQESLRLLKEKGIKLQTMHTAGDDKTYVVEKFPEIQKKNEGLQQ